MCECYRRSELSDTVKPMLSADYKERFKAEYLQLLIRKNKLERMCFFWDKGDLGFNPTCPRELYQKQLDAMNSYLDVLRQRAKLERVEL